MSAQEEYIFERVSGERLKDVKYLYKESFGENVTIEFLEKKYNTSVFGANNIGYIAYHKNGEPAAYYGVFPCKAVVKDKIYLCAQSGDTMTHPNHRGKGLFIKLAKATYRLAIENGISFVFGFPNDNSYPGFVNKLGWIHKENLKIYKISIYTFPLAYIASRIKFLSGLYRFYSSFIINIWKGDLKFFDNPNIDCFGSGILRDENFYIYKNYFKKEIIKIHGKGVYIKIAGALRVGDIELSDEAEFIRIVKRIKLVAWLLGCYAVYFYCSPETKYDKFLSSKYSYSKGLAIGWADFNSGLDLSSLKFSQADLDTY